jgi:NADPH:quinone reductase-like Zn-dependent oxidoreductase
MKVATVGAGPKVTVENAPFPELPSDKHLIIKVVVAGSNPKDWAIAERSKFDA